MAVIELVYVFGWFHCLFSKKVKLIALYALCVIVASFYGVVIRIIRIYYRVNNPAYPVY